ncbi:hypothetical protein GGF32_006352 [Allomyces javanicus]|nr:hypothetical protein GGF32_006352 [Allomyces javanicus]
MAPSTRRTFAFLLAVALIALAQAGSALADTPVTLNKWTQYILSRVGDVTPVYTVTLPEAGYVVVTDVYCARSRFSVTVNGHDQGQTSQPINNCNFNTPDPEVAVIKSDFSHGAFPLPAGTSTIQIKATVMPENGGFYFKVGQGVWVDPNLANSSGFRVVVNKGKVSTRAQAVSACTSQGMALADVTAANWAAVVNAVRASSALSLTPTDAVLISSWNGDSYADADLQLTVRATTSTVSNAGITLATGPHYPLCQPTTSVLPCKPTVIQRDGDLAIVGHAGQEMFAERMCRAALGWNAQFVVLSGARPDEFRAATTLAFNAAGANKQVWISGWEEPSDEPLVLATGSAPGGGAIVKPEDIHDEKFYLCKASTIQRRSEL